MLHNQVSDRDQIVISACDWWRVAFYLHCLAQKPVCMNFVPLLDLRTENLVRLPLSETRSENALCEVVSSSGSSYTEDLV